MQKEERMEVLSEASIKGSGLLKDILILRDKQTGVQYLCVRYNSGGGLTPLLDKEGKPIIN